MDLTRHEIVDRARRLLDQGADEESLRLLRDAIEQFPDDPEIRLLYGTALVPSHPEDAPWQLATAIKLDPDDPWRLTRAASLLYYLGQTHAARSYAARAVRLAPTDFVLAPDLTNLGGKLSALEGDHALAEEAFKAAVEACPDRPDFAYDLANFLVERERSAEARSVIEEALERIDRHGSARDARDARRLIALRDETSDA